MTTPLPLNAQIAEMFREKAVRLEAKGDERHFFRARAYRRAADAIDSLDESLEDMYKRSWIAGMQKIDGIGNRIAHDIERELKRRGIRR